VILTWERVGIGVSLKMKKTKYPFGRSSTKLRVHTHHHIRWILEKKPRNIQILNQQKIKGLKFSKLLSEAKPKQGAKEIPPPSPFGHGRKKTHKFSPMTNRKAKEKSYQNS
jgi:hypothetical protein